MLTVCVKVYWTLPNDCKFNNSILFVIINYTTISCKNQKAGTQMILLTS